MHSIIFWSDLKTFLSCSRCFYKAKRFNIKLPILNANSFTLPKTVDHQRKEESDFCRGFNITLSILEKNNIDLIPFDKERKIINEWRKTIFEGGTLNWTDGTSGVTFSGSIDDVFKNSDGELFVVDFKTTALAIQDLIKQKWHFFNELQVAYYAWLLKKVGYTVSNIAYLIYSIVYKNSLEFYPFNNRLHFKTSLVKCKNDYAYIEEAIEKMKVCLNSSSLPVYERDCKGYIKCKLCNYLERSYFVQNYDETIQKNIIDKKTK